MNPIFYRPEMVARTESFSRSPTKPKLFMDYLRGRGNINVMSFDPVTREDFYLAHDPYHVDQILDSKAPNGFGTKDKLVAKSLHYTTGSMYAAARHALKREHWATCSPSSGFHHAGYDYAEGYCTFNGLMVTAIKLKNEGLVDKVGILDCDFHYGDGTQDIIDRLGIDWIEHQTSGAHLHKPVPKQEFFRWLEHSLLKMMDCDIILYQAGQDMHKDDPLGGVLDAWGLDERDRIVRDFCMNDDIPVAWNLAGGYMQRYEKTLHGHYITLTKFGGIDD